MNTMTDSRGSSLAPRPAEVAAHQHVHALEHDAVRIVLQGEDALVAQQIVAVDLDHRRQELLELHAVERPLGAEHERLHGVVVVVMVVLEELRLDLEDRVQVEAADVEDVVDRRLPEVHRLHRRARVHLPEPPLQRLRVLVAHEIGLRQQDAVGESHLLLRLVELVELLRRVLRVDHGDHAVEQVVLADRVVEEERLRHRAGIGHAGGLDDHALEGELALLAPVLELAEDAHEVAAHGAAEAAVVHLDDLLAAVLQEEVVVDAGLAELVLDHRDPAAVVLAQDAVEQRRLAGAEEPGEDRHRHHLLLRHLVSRKTFYRALGAAALDGQLDRLGTEPARQRHAVRGRLAQADHLAAPVALEVCAARMTLVRDAEPPHPVEPGHAVGEPLLHQPVEHAVERDAIDRRTRAERGLPARDAKAPGPNRGVPRIRGAAPE